MTIDAVDGGPGRPDRAQAQLATHHLADIWDRRAAELRASASARDRFARGHRAGNPDVGLGWAGEGTDLITAVEPAGELVGQIMAQAEGLLRGASRQLDH